MQPPLIELNDLAGVLDKPLSPNGQPHHPSARPLDHGMPEQSLEPGNPKTDRRLRAT
jgi:hypothetical protein